MTTPLERHRHISTLLFDLDGTLLDIHMPSFLKAYFRALAPCFGMGEDVPRFREMLLDSVRLMLHARGGERTLDRILVEDFATRTGMAEEAVLTAFDTFHREGLETLRPLTRPFGAAKPLLEKALAAGFTLAVATNPVFLRRAVESRIRWAGLEGIAFAFISTAENMRVCKPHPEYFTEVLAALGRAPWECMMIGDDPVKDMPAALVGIATFFVPSPGERRHPETADYRGTLEDLSSWIDGRATPP